VPLIDSVVKVKVKVKNELIKRHKTKRVCKDTEALAASQLTTVFESNSKQMCL